MIKTVVFMQNAWSGWYAGSTWPRESWLDALHGCHSGRRLRQISEFAQGVEFWYDNTTPIVGATPSSVVPADDKHMRRVLREQKPDYILALGKQAGKAVAELSWTVPTLIAPHPASRTLTNKLYNKAGVMLAQGFSGLIELVQGRGEITVYHR